MSPWLWIPKPQPFAGLRLYCLPHAGGGASAFASWASASPHNVEIAAIQLPGRETRLDEEPLRSFPPIARAIGEEILSSDNRPFAIFGHSAGGKLAIHVASYLQETTDRRPMRIFLSGAPIAVSSPKFLHQLGPDEFVRAIENRFGALPRQITEDQEVWSLFERPLRADLEAHETDEIAPRRLQVPITVISGSRDQVVSAEEQSGWQEWSAYPLRYEILDGDHFTYRKQPQMYLNSILTHLLSG
jgi:medium-chain acyl-[acyl-carrier-protein] hydrolase